MSRDICADFAHALRHPSPEGIPADGPIEELKASGVNVVDIRSHMEALANSVGPSLYNLSAGRTARQDGTTATVFAIEAEKLPLVEPLCWPFNGWWLVTERLLLATFPLDSADDGFEAFGAYPVTYSSRREMAASQGVDQALVDRLEAAGAHDLDSHHVMSPTGLMQVFIDRSRNVLVIDPSLNGEPPRESEQAGYTAVISAICLLVTAANLMSADGGVVRTVTRPQRLVAKQRRRYGFATERTTTINLPGLRYESGRWNAKTGAGVAWHMVRGHWRELKDERYKHKRGQRVWVRPHAKGTADLGTVTHTYMLDGKASA
jgi:hypothetical protein